MTPPSPTHAPAGERMAGGGSGHLAFPVAAAVWLRPNRVARTTTALSTALAMTTLLALVEPASASPRENIERVIESIEAATGEDVLSRYPYEDHPDGNEHCLQETFCEGFIDELRIEAMGRRIDISPSPRTPPEILFGSCVGLLGTFVPDKPLELVEKFVHGVLSRVIEGERIKAEFETFRFEMKLNAENLPACSVIRFVQR